MPKTHFSRLIFKCDSICRFWFPEAQFGATKGVLRTRVGYAGGTKPSPTYYSLGDHTETVELDYDPEVRELD